MQRMQLIAARNPSPRACSVRGARAQAQARPGTARHSSAQHSTARPTQPRTAVQPGTSGRPVPPATPWRGVPGLVRGRRARGPWPQKLHASGRACVGVRHVVRARAGARAPGQGFATHTGAAPRSGGSDAIDAIPAARAADYPARVLACAAWRRAHGTTRSEVRPPRRVPPRRAAPPPSWRGLPWCRTLRVPAGRGCMPIAPIAVLPVPGGACAAGHPFHMAATPSLVTHHHHHPSPHARSRPSPRRHRPRPAARVQRPRHRPRQRLRLRLRHRPCSPSADGTTPFARCPPARLFARVGVS